MAEFCLECWREMRGEKGKGKRCVLSSGVDFCEGCGQWKPVVLWEEEADDIRPYGLFQILWGLLTVPYRLYACWRKKRKNTEYILREGTEARPYGETAKIVHVGGDASSPRCKKASAEGVNKE